MNRKFLPALAFILCIAVTDIQAQRGNNYLSIGASLGLPLNFDHSHELGAGAGLRGYFGAGPGAVLLNVNALSFPHEHLNRNLVLTSVKVGYSTNPAPGNLFGYFDVGLTHDNRSDKDVLPGVGFGIGYAIPVRNGGSVDIVPNFNAAFYRNWTRTWLDIHIAYKFAVRGR